MLSWAQRITLLAVVLAVAISYAPSLDNGFTNWDDNIYVTGNAAIRSLTTESVADIFSSSFGGMYTPLVLLTFAVEYHLVGEDAFLYHADNLLLHLGNTLLVFLFVFMLCRTFPLAAATALFFGIHPLHVESVAWIAERKDLLYGLFFLSALISYVRYKQTGSRPGYYLSLLFFALSMMSKPQAVLFALILLAIDYAYFHPITRGTLFEKTPFLAVSALFVFINAPGLAHAAVLPQGHLLAFIGRAHDVAYGFLWYQWKLLAPVKLSSFYPPPLAAGGWERVLYHLSPVVVALLVLLVAFSVRYTRKVVFASLFVAINLALPLYLIPVQHSLVYDRYSYIPSIGLLYLLAEGAAWALRRDGRYRTHVRIALPLAAALTAGAFCVQTWKRSDVWESSTTLWSDVIRTYPSVAVAHFNLGIAQLGEGKLDEAAGRFLEAIRLNPGFDRANLNLGNVLAHQGKVDEATYRYEEALRINPRLLEARLNLGDALAVQGRFEEAAIQYREVLRADSGQASVHYNIGYVLLNIGGKPEAIDHFREALRLEPDHELARLSLELLGAAVEMRGETMGSSEDNDRHSSQDSAK